MLYCTIKASKNMMNGTFEAGNEMFFNIIILIWFLESTNDVNEIFLHT